jgi:death-on-curing protein
MKHNKSLVFISIHDVHEMHDTVINELGGRPGIHNEGLLESAINQPLMLLDYGSDEEQEIVYLAATYFFHIIKNHPFIDGNKRTGVLVAINFLAQNGYEISNPNENTFDNLYQIALDTAASKINIKEIAAFFEKLIGTKSHS